VTGTALLYAACAAAANLAGAAVVTSRRGWSRGAHDALLALAAGFMLSVALVDLLPESVEHGGTAAGALVLAGFLLVHVTQHVLGRHFHFGEETHPVSEAVGAAALAGLLLHTFVDGVAVASGLRVSDALGMLVFAGVVLHKIPEGLAIASLFLAAGAPPSRAMAAASALGLATFLGVLATDEIPLLAAWGLPLAAGVTLYVGASNLVPEFQAKGGWRATAGFGVGVALFFATRAVARP